ncbi:hypothetical protein JOQ06_030406, partial [Pogonophryne albipinna]
SHTAEALAAAFREMFRSWGIPTEKAHVIRRDNAKNMVKAMKDADLPSLPCMAHTLQLVVAEGRLYAIATLLDLRYKDRYFPDALKPQLRVLLLGILATRSGSSPEQHEKRSEASGSEPPEKVPRAGSLQAMYEELLDGDVEHGAGSNDSSQNASQMNLFLSEPLLPRSGQPLAFWQDNKSRFPALAEAARAYLCAPCTSVDSERLFSTAANVVDEKRNRLTSKNAEMLIFINKNLTLMRMK